MAKQGKTTFIGDIFGKAPLWSADVRYNKGERAVLSGSIYISQTDNNKGNDPSSDTTNWKISQKSTIAKVIAGILAIGTTGTLLLNTGTQTDISQVSNTAGTGVTQATRTLQIDSVPSNNTALNIGGECTVLFDNDGGCIDNLDCIDNTALICTDGETTNTIGDLLRSLTNVNDSNLGSISLSGATNQVIFTSDELGEGYIIYQGFAKSKIAVFGDAVSNFIYDNSTSGLTATNPQSAIDELDTSVDLNNTHRTSNGSDHSYINQDVTTTASPTHAGLTLSGLSDGLVKSTTGVLSGGNTADISDDTNLAVNDPITLTDDTLALAINSTNLQITANQLNTIQDISTNSDVTFNNGTYTGNLVVQGNLTPTDTTIMNVTDNSITANKGEVGSVITAGISCFQVDRGSGTDTAVCYKESDSFWSLGSYESLFGTTVSSTNTTIVLDGSASAVDDTYNNLIIKLYKENELAQTRTITDYTGITKTADVSLAWTINPDVTWDYQILGTTDTTLRIATIEDTPTSTGLPYWDGTKYKTEAGFTYTEGTNTLGVDIINLINGFQDADVSTAIKLGDSSNTSFITTNKTMIGAVNEGHALINTTQSDTGFVNPEDVIVSWNKTTRTIELTGTIEAYWRGTLITELVSGWTSTAHDTGFAAYFLYYDDTGFHWSTNTPPSFNTLSIAVVNLRDTAIGYQFTQREIHGFMDWRTHQNLHFNLGTYRSSGGDISGLTFGSVTPVNRRPDVSAVLCYDEDAPFTNLALTEKVYANKWIEAGRVIYQEVAQPEIVPVLLNQPYYNPSIGGGDYNLTLMPANSVMTVWLAELPVADDTDSQGFGKGHVFVTGQYITQAPNGSAGAIQVARDSELARTTVELELGLTPQIATEFVFIQKFIIVYTGGNWYISDTAIITGSRANQVGQASGQYLTVVSANGGLSGTGISSDPLTNTFYSGLVGGQTIIGGTLTTESLNIRANAADLTTGQINMLSSKEATSTSNASMVLSGGLGVAKDIFATNVNAITALKLNGTDINTAGTLSNVAYENQSNIFTFAQTIQSVSDEKIALKDNGVGDGAINYIGFYDGSGTPARQGFFGFASGSNSNINLNNEVSGGNINFITTGLGSVNIGDTNKLISANGGSALHNIIFAGNSYAGTSSGTFYNNLIGNRSYFMKSRNETVGNYTTALLDNDEISSNYYEGADGVISRTGAFYKVTADGNASSGIVPMKFTWDTMNSSGTLAERMRLDSSGNVGIGTTDLDGTPAIGRLTLKGSTNDGSTNGLVIRDSDEVNVFEVDTNGLITASGGIFQKTVDSLLEINNYGATTQATGGTYGIRLGNNFNTNSLYSNYNIFLENFNNTGTGKNTGIHINNRSTDFTSASANSGAGFSVQQIGVDGTAIAIKGFQNINSTTSGLFNITLDNTQSGASYLSKLDTGTSTQDHLWLQLKGTRGAIEIGDSDQAPSTKTNKLYSLSNNLTWGGNITATGTITSNNLISESNNSSVEDEAFIDLPSGISGWCFVQAGDGEEYAKFSFTTAGIVTLLSDTSTNVVNTDTDGNLCIFDNGTNVRIKNRLGSAKIIKFNCNY